MQYLIFVGVEGVAKAEELVESFLSKFYKDKFDKPATGMSLSQNTLDY